MCSGDPLFEPRLRNLSKLKPKHFVFSFISKTSNSSVLFIYFFDNPEKESAVDLSIGERILGLGEHGGVVEGWVSPISFNTILQNMRIQHNGGLVK